MQWNHARLYVSVLWSSESSSINLVVQYGLKKKGINLQDFPFLQAQSTFSAPRNVNIVYL